MSVTGPGRTDTPVIAVRRVPSPRYRLDSSADHGRAWMRRWRTGGGGAVTVGADAQITDLTVDDHACLTFGEPEDLFDLTAAFVRDGLACGLKVVWISDSAPQRATSELTRRGVAVESALAAGQLAAAECEGRLLSGQEFGAGRAMDWLDSPMAAVHREGVPRLRGGGD